MKPNLNWRNAGIRWGVDEEIDYYELTIQGVFGKYAALLIEQELPTALEELSIGGVPLVLADPVTVSGSGIEDWGTIRIRARNLMDRFEATEIRRVVQETFDEAVKAEEEHGERFEAQGNQYINDLAAEPSAS